MFNPKAQLLGQIEELSKEIAALSYRLTRELARKNLVEGASLDILRGRIPRTYHRQNETLSGEFYGVSSICRYSLIGPGNSLAIALSKTISPLDRNEIETLIKLRSANEVILMSRQRFKHSRAVDDTVGLILRDYKPCYPVQ